MCYTKLEYSFPLSVLSVYTTEIIHTHQSVEAYTAQILTETGFMSEFYLGTVHDMQVRYYNCGKNRTPVIAQ